MAFLFFHFRILVCSLTFCVQSDEHLSGRTKITRYSGVVSQSGVNGFLPFAIINTFIKGGCIHG